MQIHIRGQNNHVLEVQPTETIGEIKVSSWNDKWMELAEPQQIKMSVFRDFWSSKSLQKQMFLTISVTQLESIREVI